MEHVVLCGALALTNSRLDNAALRDLQNALFTAATAPGFTTALMAVLSAAARAARTDAASSYVINVAVSTPVPASLPPAVASACAALTAGAAAAPAGAAMLTSGAGISVPVSSSMRKSIRNLLLSFLRQTVVARGWTVHDTHRRVQADEDSFGGIPSADKAALLATFTLSEEEKAVVRSIAPTLFNDADESFREGIARAVADVAADEWATVWPHFLDNVTSVLNAFVSAPHADVVLPVGATYGEGDARTWLVADATLRCVERWFEKIDVRQSFDVAVRIMPSLVACTSLTNQGAAATGPFAMNMRARAFLIVRSMFESLESAGAMDKGVKKSVAILMDAAMEAYLPSVMAAAAVHEWDVPACSLKASAQRSVNMLTQMFPRKAADVLPSLGPSLLNLAAQTMHAYAQFELDTDADERVAATRTSLPCAAAAALAGCVEEVDDDSGAQPSTVLSNLLAWMQIVLCSEQPAFKAAMRASSNDWAALLLCASQLSESTLAVWAEEPAAFLRDECDELSLGISLRKDVYDAVLDFVDVCGKPGLDALLSVTGAALMGSTASVTSPLAAWSAQRWKIVEAAVYMVGCCRKYLLHPERLEERASKSKPKRGASKRAAAATGAGSAPAPMDVPTFVAQLLTLIKSGGAGAFDADTPEVLRILCAPYLLGRCFWCASYLAPAVPLAACEELLAATVEGLQDSYPIPLRITACRALGRLLRRVDKSTVEAIAPTVLDRLHLLITNSIIASSARAVESGGAAEGSVDVGETASVLIELLVYTCLFAPAAAASRVQPLTSLLLHLWMRKANSPYLAPTLSSGLEALVLNADDAAAMHAMRAMLPSIHSVLEAARVAETDASAPLPDYVLPDGSTVHVTQAAIKADLLPSPVTAADMAMHMVTAMLRRTRELMVRPDGSGSVPAHGNLYFSPPPEVRALISLVAQLVGICQDHKVLASGAVTLTAATRLCGPVLFHGEHADAHLAHILLTAAGRLITYGEDAGQEVAAAACPLVTALMSHSSVPGIITSVLPLVLQRIANSTGPTAITRLCHVVAHALLLDADATLPVLMSTSVTLPARGPLSLQSEAPTEEEAQAMQASLTAAAAAGSGAPTQLGVVIFCRAVNKFFSLIVAPLTKALLIAALAALLPHASVLEALASVTVLSDQTEILGASAASSVAAGTRGATKGKTRKVSVTLAVRVLSIVIKQWADLVASEEDADTNDSDSEAEEGGAARGARHRPSPFADADDVAHLLGEHDDSDADEEDMMYLADLMSGGNGMGMGTTLNDLIRAAAMGHSDDEEEEDDGGDGLGFNVGRQFDDEEMEDIATWEEVADAGEEAVKYGMLPRDPVLRAYVEYATAPTDEAVLRAAAAGKASEDEELMAVSVKSAGSQLTTFLTQLATAAQQAPTSVHGALVSATMPVLPESERNMVLKHVSSAASSRV